ncbi:hypothetical protein P280DRAFT_483674 [Massarina eburnea CBS 473.64]|uniref:F-box domain-containing protein n=1 Tax=Massarina eburnea CBS 473.64 TaxID=1395130 RepID=A0A6A6RN79_9PLEO|nr:hypothetical protein P280DRAFT_483674 [Massarina eburnea CBS 473.64]
MDDVASAGPAFPFLELPRELRDQIYNNVFAIPDERGDRALRIERRHLKYFEPSASAILLLLHHECLLLNRQVCREALETLFKKHVVFFSCGPYILKQLLTRIETHNGPPKQWLKWIKRMEFDWVTFPNLKAYPPERSDGRDEWWWEQDGEDVYVDNVRGAQYDGHYDEHDYDEHDYEDGYYDDNLYGAEDSTLYPSWPQQGYSTTEEPDPGPVNDFLGLANHYPFATAVPQQEIMAAHDVDTKLDLLVSMEVTPLFDYLCTSTFALLSSLTIPLYFISKPSRQNRHATRPDATLPTKIRYWVQICVHALLMLHDPATALTEVRVKYMPWDVWASMDPSDDLHRMVEKGIWFLDTEDREDERSGEGEAFRAVWNALREKHGLCNGDERMGLCANVRFLKWAGDLGKWRVGDELEVVFTNG